MLSDKQDGTSYENSYGNYTHSNIFPEKKSVPTNKQISEWGIKKKLSKFEHDKLK